MQFLHYIITQRPTESLTWHFCVRFYVLNFGIFENMVLLHACKKFYCRLNTIYLCLYTIKKFNRKFQRNLPHELNKCTYMIRFLWLSQQAWSTWYACLHQTKFQFYQIGDVCVMYTANPITKWLVMNKVIWL